MTAAPTNPTQISEFASSIGAVGLNHRLADFRMLANYAVSADRRTHVAARLRELGLDEFIILSTCNRVEVYFSCGDVRYPSRKAGALAKVILQILAKDTEIVNIDNVPYFALDGADAAKHIFEVCASLDSLVVGEQQITGQLRQAVAHAEELGTIGPRLRTIAHEAFRIARRVRRETRLCRGASVVSLATEQLINSAQRIFENTNVNLPIALVGAGEMTERAAITLTKRSNIHILFVNRTISKAIDLAKRFGGSALSLSEFISNPPAIAACMTATSAPFAIFTKYELLKLQKAREDVISAKFNDRLTIVDLAVPFDVDPNISRSYSFDIIRMDQLRMEANRLAELQQNEVASAREILNKRFELLVNRDRHSAALGNIRAQAEEVAKTWTRRLEGSLARRRVVDQFGARAMESAHRLAHASHSNSPNIEFIVAREIRLLSFPGARLLCFDSHRVNDSARGVIAEIAKTVGAHRPETVAS